MKKWSYGTNSLYRECVIFCDEEPWWVEPFSNALCWVCDRTPRLPLPFLKRLKHVEEGGEVCTFAEWYGGTLHALFCEFVHIPLNNWAYGKVKQIYRVDVGWEKGKELFYADDPERWDEEEKEYPEEEATHE